MTQFIEQQYLKKAKFLFYTPLKSNLHQIKLEGSTAVSNAFWINKDKGFLLTVVYTVYTLFEFLHAKSSVNRL